LNAAGVPTYQHQGIPGTLHHKLFIVDGDYPDADPTDLTGSHNWSTNAESVNDENTVVVHDALIANL
jgi:phosphatidylserine/phosphatidylglycerophosphate/cardiolipin synthase-like enzyme